MKEIILKILHEKACNVKAGCGMSNPCDPAIGSPSTGGCGSNPCDQGYTRHSTGGCGGNPCDLSGRMVEIAMKSFL